MRILSCAQVNNARALGSWLSYDDLVHLVEQAISTPTTGFSIIYGVSDNDRVPVDNARASFLGYRPSDNAEQFAGNVLSQEPPQDLSDPKHLYQGGPFAAIELGDSGLATMNVIDDRKEI